MGNFNAGRQGNAQELGISRKNLRFGKKRRKSDLMAPLR
jgi:hypothetical protein